MHFQIVAALTVLSGVVSSAPTGDKVTLHDKPFFSGGKVSWPVDNKCHAIKDEASKLDMVNSVTVSENVVCYLHDEVECEGGRLDLHSPGTPDLMMLMHWAERAKSMKCSLAKEEEAKDEEKKD